MNKRKGVIHKMTPPFKDKVFFNVNYPQEKTFIRDHMVSNPCPSPVKKTISCRDNLNNAQNNIARNYIAKSIFSMQTNKKDK